MASEKAPWILERRDVMLFCEAGTLLLPLLLLLLAILLTFIALLARCFSIKYCRWFLARPKGYHNVLG